MTTELNNAINDWLLAIADERLILAHRDSEWTGHAPILEEDIALANIAQDELGYANLWYGLLTRLKGEDETYPDRLVYRREAAQWRNLQLVELPKGDWAFTILRQYFMDVYEHVLLAQLEHSTQQDIVNIAVKAHREKLYHFKHTSAWVKRLALGTEESHRRMQTALDQQWPYVAQLFEPLPGEGLLVEAGIVPACAALQAEWQNLVLPELAAGRLSVPELQASTFHRTQHSPHLNELLNDLQLVARLDPQAEW